MSTLLELITKLLSHAAELKEIGAALATIANAIKRILDDLGPGERMAAETAMRILIDNPNAGSGEVLAYCQSNPQALRYSHKGAPSGELKPDDIVKWIDLIRLLLSLLGKRSGGGIFGGASASGRLQSAVDDLSSDDE